MTDNTKSAEETWQRRIAVQCNNAAWDLIEQPTLDLRETAELVRLASTASYRWQRIGTLANVAHAGLLFSWAAARAGAGPIALNLASRALSYFAENPSEDWELAFAHTAMAVAFYCNGDSDGHKHHYEAAKELGDTLPPKEARPFLAAFRSLPIP
jgi:hypothetical protein